MKIRKARLSDAKEILALLNSSAELQGINNDKFYTIQYVKGAIRSKDRDLVLIAEEKGKIAGFLIAEIWKHKKYSFLCDIYIKPEFRRKKSASILQKEYERICRMLDLNSITLLVITDNRKMRSWCSKHKYRKGKKMYFYEKKLK